MKHPFLAASALALCLLAQASYIDDNSLADDEAEQASCAANSLLQAGRRLSHFRSSEEQQPGDPTAGGAPANRGANADPAGDELAARLGDMLGGHTIAEETANDSAANATAAATPGDNTSAEETGGDSPANATAAEPGGNSSAEEAADTHAGDAPAAEAGIGGSEGGGNATSSDAADANASTPANDLNASVEEGPTPYPAADAHLAADDALWDITVRVHTAPASLDHFSGSATGASMAFRIGPSWTEDVELFNHTESGGTTERAVRLPDWPLELRLKALGNDSWFVDEIVLRLANKRTGRDTNVTVLAFNVSRNNATYSNSSKFWLDLNEEAPVEQIYAVPPLPPSAQSAAAASHGCTTRADVRAEAIGFDTAEPGTACLFGVDPRDEGSHCIMEDGYSFGWCYTDADMVSFGACNEACPLVGPAKVLASKLDEVLRRLDQ